MRQEFPQDTGIPTFDSFAEFDLVRDPIPMMHIPNALWKAASAEINKALHADGKGLEFSNGDVYVISQITAEGRRRLAFCSNLTRYNEVLFRFAAPLPQRIENLHQFPCYPLMAAPEDGLLKCVGHHSEVFGRLVVPPKGLLIVEASAT